MEHVLLSVFNVHALCGAAGLFLHVGYSVVERHVIERNSNLRLDSEVMLHKLTALLRQSLAFPNNQVSKIICRIFRVHESNFQPSGVGKSSTAAYWLGVKAGRVNLCRVAGSTV